MAEVVIDASLNTSAMESAINILVNDVDRKMKDLAGKFDESVTKMEQSLKRMKDSAKDSTTTKNAQEKKSVSELGESYDKLTSAMQAAAAQASRRWDVSSIQTYRMQLHEIESEMHRLFSVSWDQGYEQWRKVGSQIEATRNQIQQLTQEQERLKSTLVANRFEEQQRLQQYQQLGAQIDALKAKEQELVASHSRLITEFAKETPAGKQLEQVRQQYASIQQKIRDMGNAMQQEAAAEVQKTKELERQEQILRQQVDSSRRISESVVRSSGTGAYEVGPITPLTAEELQRVTQAREADHNALEKEIRATQSLNDAQGQLNSTLANQPHPKRDAFTTYDDLRSALASVLNMERDQIRIADQSVASYNRMNLSLGQMVEAYHRLNAEQRKSSNGKNLANEIQMTKRAMQELQNQMARPVSLKAALGLSENTLDAITYKLQQLSKYRAGIDLSPSNKNAASEIEKVNGAIDRLKKKQDELIGTNKRLQDSNTWLARSFQYMKNRLAFYFTVGASTQFLKNLIEIRSQYEMTERALGILVDSAERGSQIFNELSEMALKSPFTLIELSNAAKQLTAYDVAAKDVVDTTRRLADMASAVGVNIDRLTYALGQVKAYGYLNARDARMFANAGIPLVKQLADYYTELEGRMVSVGDVYDRIKKKAVGYEDTMAVITKMTDEGGKFFDFQAKMADTLKVQLANLTLAWNNMLNSIGQSNQGLLTFPIQALKELFLRWRQISNIVSDSIVAFGAFKVVQLGVALGFEKMGMKASIATVSGTRLTNVLKSLKASMMSLASNPWTWVFVGIMAITELIWHFKRTQDAAEELNAAIEKSADESVKSLRKFKELNKESIADLKAGIIKPEDTTKLWESIKEELENSADSSSTLVAELMKTQDIGERVKKALEFSDKIEEANIALKNMHGELIKIEDDLLWGALGEGMVSDIKDWVEQLKVLKSISRQPFDTDQSFENINFYEQQDYLKKEQEALIEIQKVAIQAGEAIEAALGEGIKDKIKLNEAVARVKQQIKLAKPEIQGEVADWFDMQLDRVFSIRWAGFYDETTTLWDKLMEELKKDNSSLFNNITEDWLNGTEQMSDAQKKAFTDAANHLRETLPPKFTETLDAMMADLNSRDFRIRVGISFNVSQLDAVQRDFNRRFLGSPGGQINVPMVLSPQAQKDYESRMQKYSRFNRKEGESTLAWQKRLSDEYKNQNDDLILQQRIVKQTSGDRQKAAQAELEADQEIVSILKEIAGYEGLDLSGKNGKTKNKTNKSRVKEKDLVAKALSQELSVIREMQSAYDKLRKSGVGTTEALQIASSGYDKTLKSINATLSKYGISPFKAEDFVGSADPHKLLTALQNQLDTLIKSGKVKTASLKDLEMEIKKITVDAKEYDMKKITDGLNNELGKIKEEYELAVELDANPELGDMFAQAFGIDTSDFPKTVQEAVDRMQDATNKAIAEYTFGEGIDIDVNDLMHPFDILNDDIDEWSKSMGLSMSNEFKDSLKKMQHDARDLYEKDAKQTISDWQKLLEKYAEYETKRTEIQKQAEKERETARKHGASQEIIDAINLKEQRDLAKLDFDEFQKTAYWITATGDLSRLSNSALQMLIDKLMEYKRAAKNLDPKDIIKLNNAMRKLRKEQKRDNPFNALSIASQEATERAEMFDEEIDIVSKKFNDLLNKREKQGGLLSEDDQKLLDEYKAEFVRLIGLKYEASKIPFIEKVKQVGQYVKAFKTVADTFKEIADTTNDFDLKQTADAISDVIGNFEAAEQGAQTWGGWWGAIIGGVTDAIPKIMKWVSGNAQIDYDIQQSQIQVKKLTNFYKELEAAANKAYGVEAYGAQKAMLINKEFQKTELERQLKLEKSRKKKYQDQSAIADLEGQIIDLKNEINESTENIVNDLLGITSKADFAENLVSSMIDAFKNGEDYMKVFEESFEDMVDNMIMKAIVSRLVGDWINSIWDKVNAKVAQSDRVREAEKNLKEAESKLQGFEELANESPTYTNLQLRDMWRKKYEEALTAYNNAITPTPEDIATMREFFEQGRDDFKNNFLAYMDAFGIKFGQSAGQADLSALQQGIQGITEDTAGALESYMNSVSQQVYYQSDILTQIRDILVNFGGDVTIATNAQILFELQQSYQVQMSIQSILQGWSNASGLAVRVEMV